MVAMKKIALVGQWIAGLALLLSGMVKIWEPVLFYWQIIPYTQLLKWCGQSRDNQSCFCWRLQVSSTRRAFWLTFWKLSR